LADLEECPSGRRSTLGKRVCVTSVPWVRIPPPPKTMGGETMEGVSKNYRRVVRPRRDITDGRSRAVAWVAGANIRRILRYAREVAGNGARVGARVDRAELWFSKRGVLRIIIGDAGAVRFGGQFVRKYDRLGGFELRKRLEKRRLRATAMIQRVYSTFSGDGTAKEVVWRRTSDRGFEGDGAWIAAKTEATFRHHPNGSQTPQSSVEANENLDPE
jgi:hypothetical protein